MSLITVIGDGLTVAYNNKDIPPSVSGWLSIAPEAARRTLARPVVA